MKNEQNDIDSWLQQAAANGQVPVVETHWQQMKQLLVPERKKRRFFLLWWLAGSLLLLGGTWYGLEQHSRQPTQTAPSTTQQERPAPAVAFSRRLGKDTATDSARPFKHLALRKNDINGADSNGIIRQPSRPAPVPADTTRSTYITRLPPNHRLVPGHTAADTRVTNPDPGTTWPRRSTVFSRQQQRYTASRNRNTFLLSRQHTTSGSNDPQLPAETIDLLRTTPAADAQAACRHQVQLPVLHYPGRLEPDSLLRIPLSLSAPPDMALLSTPTRTRPGQQPKTASRHQFLLETGYRTGRLPVKASGPSFRAGYQYHPGKHFAAGIGFEASRLQVREEQLFRMVRVTDFPGTTLIGLYVEEKTIRPADGWLLMPSLRLGYTRNRLLVAAALQTGFLVNGTNLELSASRLDTIALRTAGWANTNNTYNERNFTGRRFTAYEISVQYRFFGNLYLGTGFSSRLHIRNSGLLTDDRRRNSIVFFTGISF